MALSFIDIVLRLLTAMFISLVVGLERERTHRPAGLRTHMLVSLGSCIAMITGVMIWH
ncbi:MAG: MgtC/SapB family protein, partial [Butyricicoccus sp.]|nr:MgtC/SapB family protein [Butyricicoccus sp.]